MSMKYHYQRVRRILRRDDAATTVEFVVLFPVVLLVFFIAAENVVVNLKTTILDSAVDRTIRELRMGMIAAPSQSVLESLICEKMGSPINCVADLVLEMTVGTFSSSTGAVILPSASAACVSKSTFVDPVVSFSFGGSNDLIFVRACYTVDVSMPMSIGTVSVADQVGTEHRLISTAVFMNEPN
jgi:hypothetical protein